MGNCYLEVCELVQIPAPFIGAGICCFSINGVN